MYHEITALYVWNGSEWVLVLPIWRDDKNMNVRKVSYSANGSSWTS